MKEGYVHSDPQFFSRVRRALAGAAVVLLGVSAWLPAPLQEPADPLRVPNPVKAAWFLVWVQELVSYSNALLYAALLTGAVFVALPWLPGAGRGVRASWLPSDQRWVNALTLVVFGAIVALTIVAIFFRGKNWQLCWPS